MKSKVIWPVFALGVVALLAYVALSAYVVYLSSDFPSGLPTPAPAYENRVSLLSGSTKASTLLF